MFDDALIEANQGRMQSTRSAFDATCQEVAAMVLPDRSAGFQGQTSQGASEATWQMDEYGAQALQDGVSLFEGFTMPRGQKWQGLRFADEALMALVPVQQWLERVQTRIFALRNDPKSGFTTNVHASAESLFAFWGQSMWVDKRYDENGRFAGLSYQSEDIATVWVDRDAAGNVMRVHKLFRLTAEQALDKFGEDAPEKVREAMSGTMPQRDRPFEFLHVIERNPRPMPGRIDAAGMAWRACYYSRADKKVFRVGGYHKLRRIVSTWSRKAGEDYGRSPAMQLINTLRAAQILMQDRVLAVEYATKGSWLAVDDDLDRAIVELGPDGIIWGGLDESGRERIKQVERRVDNVSAEALHGEICTRIDKGFFRDLLQLNRELKTHISAARTMEETAEKGVLLSPLARQEGEWFAPLLDVEIDLIWDEGLLDDMPREVIEHVRRGGGVQAIYDNQLTRMMEATEAAGYLRTAEQVVALGQLDPSVVPAFTREYPLEKVIPGLGMANGIPARWRSTDDEKAARDEADAQKAQLEQLLQAAPVLADTAKNAAAAGVM